MRSAQVYRWQIPMDAGVVLRDRRLKTRDGLLVHLQQNSRQGWGEISPLPGFSLESLAEAETALLAWVNAWRDGKSPHCQTFHLPRSGLAARLLSLTVRCLTRRITALRRFVQAIPMSCLNRWPRCRVKKSLK